MTELMHNPVLSFAKSICEFVRKVIDGPNPSAPYSWVGSKSCCLDAKCANCRKTDGYVGIC